MGGISILEVTLKPFYGLRHWLLLCLLDTGYRESGLLGAAGSCCELLGAAASCHVSRSRALITASIVLFTWAWAPSATARVKHCAASKPGNVLKYWMAMHGRYHRG